MNGEDIHTFKIDKKNQVSTEIEEKPSQIQLKQNYPNPFNPVTTIEYQISKTVQVQLSVFDSTGRKISELVNAFQPQGNYQVQFNGSNLASGVYIVELNAGDFREKIQITLVK